MNTALNRMFGLEVPICAFSHCRDVVVGVSQAGGLGVLGTSRYSPEQFDLELSIIDTALDGRPYGVSIIFPGRDTDQGTITEHDIVAQIPDDYWAFVQTLAKRFDISLDTASDETVSIDGIVSAYPLTRERALAMVEVVLRHPVKLVSSALGPPTIEVAESLHSHGIKVAGLVGDPKHVRRHAEAGVDIIVATGTEAGGHSGDIGSLVLTPEVVKAASPLPVLTAGGVGHGDQLAAALALGAEGVWTGSVWLTTIESDLPEEVKQKLLTARASDTVRSRSLSGRTVRQLRTPWVDAWEHPDAPRPLPPPLQGVLVKNAMIGMFRNGNREVIGTPVGQIVGDLDGIKTVREVMFNFMTETLEALDRINSKFEDG